MSERAKDEGRFTAGILANPHSNFIASKTTGAQRKFSAIIPILFRIKPMYPNVTSEKYFFRRRAQMGTKKQYGVLWFKFVMLNMSMTYRTKLPTDSQIVVATDATL